MNYGFAGWLTKSAVYATHRTECCRVCLWDDK